MSKTKVIEGEEYILKSAVDEIVRQRISKYSEKTREAEMKIDQLQSEIDDSRSKIAVSDKLTAQIDDLTQQLNQARTQYERHSTISEYGITDPSLRDAVEYFHEKEMSGRTKKDQQSLGDWLSAIKSDPSTAPTVLRPHFVTPEQPSNTAPVETPTAQTQGQAVVQAVVPPTSNQGVQPTSNTTSSDLLTRASDPVFFTANRAAIREAYYSQRGKPSGFKS